MLGARGTRWRPVKWTNPWRHAAAGNVGGHEDGHSTGSEVGERLLPCRLAKVAVDGGGAYVVSTQLRDQTVGLALGAREDQRPGNASGDGARHLHSVHLVDGEE